MVRNLIRWAASAEPLELDNFVRTWGTILWLIFSVALVLTLNIITFRDVALVAKDALWTIAVLCGQGIATIVLSIFIIVVTQDIRPYTWTPFPVKKDAP